MSERERARERERERERAKEREGERERKRERVCVCVCERESECEKMLITYRFVKLSHPHVRICVITWFTTSTGKGLVISLVNRTHP